jgi:hypothetical protein
VWTSIVALSEMWVGGRRGTCSDSDGGGSSPYDRAGTPHYVGFDTCLEFFRSHGLLDRQVFNVGDGKVEKGGNDREVENRWSNLFPTGLPVL